MKPVTALKPLARLVGRWEVLIHWSKETHKLVGGPAEVNGGAKFEWLEGGRFLYYQSGGGKAPGTSDWIIGRDDDSGEYYALYSDDRSVSRVYRLSLSRDVWRMWRDAPRFRQRFNGKIKDDGRIIKAYWERSSNGKDWMRDFDVIYKKVS